jgi:hypothetical protein
MIDSALILVRAAECYEFSPAQATPLSGGHFSTIYEFPRKGKTFILRVTPPNAEIDVSAMRAALSWMSYLSANGASVPSPMHSRQGNLIESFQLDHELYVLVAFEKDSCVGRFMLGRRGRIENDTPYINLNFASLAEEIVLEISRSSKFG